MMPGAGILDVNFDNFILVMYLDPIAVGAYSFCQRINKMGRTGFADKLFVEGCSAGFFQGEPGGGKRRDNSKLSIAPEIGHMFFKFPCFVFSYCIAGRLSPSYSVVSFTTIT